MKKPPVKQTRKQQSVTEKSIEANRRAKRIIRHRRVHLYHVGDGGNGNGESSDGPTGSVERASYSIAEFCVAHRISPALFFKLKKLGQGPREMQTGGRITISIEAAAQWRREREAAAAAAAEAEREKENA